MPRSALFRIPKEHGAWAMLYVPFVLGILVAGRVSWAVLWALLAMTALFFAREALRRWRRARAQGRPARDLLQGLGVEIAVPGSKSHEFMSGRFLPIIFVLALAGSLAAQKRVPTSAGTLPTHGPLFVGLLTGTVVLVAALTFLPALALGPIAEALA